jgi:hypothetical protein
VRRRPFLASVALVVFALVLPDAAAGVVAPTTPSVRLFAPSRSVTVEHYPGEPPFFDPGIYLASVGGAFEIHAWRADYDHGVQAAQFVATTRGTRRRNLPSSLVGDLTGLPNFFAASLRTANGAVVSTWPMSFCPAGQDARVGSGPFNPTYPRFCFSANPFGLGAVWGIDRGWAVSALGFTDLPPDLADGKYRLTVSIAPADAEFFGVAKQATTTSISITLKTVPNPCAVVCPRPQPLRPATAARAKARPALGAVRTVVPPSDTLPDLVALPAWNVTTSTEGGRDYLGFAATIWNAGPGPLLVEGYRRGSKPTMDAWQYFMRAGVVVGRARAGSLAYDPRPGHEHWHFKQFAAYSLRDADGHPVVASQKEAFCLAPTDAIDLTARGADWHPGSTGLFSACGAASSIWTREVLPAGWGDTYIQSLPGQSFDITGLPNGTYQIAVQANPGGLIRELRRANDLAIRVVQLGGIPGARTVAALPWHGIAR